MARRKLKQAGPRGPAWGEKTAENSSKVRRSSWAKARLAVASHASSLAVVSARSRKERSSEVGMAKGTSN